MCNVLALLSNIGLSQKKLAKEKQSSLLSRGSVKRKKGFMTLLDHLHWRRLCDNTGDNDIHHCTSHGHLGRCDTDRIVSIYVASPKVAMASTMVTVACRHHWHYYA
jgi:hypothetical protein